jgi:hypothetical protein
MPALEPKLRVRRRPRLVVVIGLWALCFPNFIAGLLIIIDLLLNYRTRSNLVIFWLAVGTLYLTGTILYRVTRNYLTIPPEKDDELELQPDIVNEE